MSPFKTNRLAAAIRGLAVILAVALLLLGLLGANGQFHQALHSGDKAASSTCLLCLFAKGQVDLPQSVTVVSTAVKPLLDSSTRLEPVLVLDYTRLAFPGRAPPALALLHSVVA